MSTSRMFGRWWTGGARALSGSGPRPAVCWPRPDYGPLEVQRSQLLNGVKVAAAQPMGAQVAACTIMFQAGSRYEADGELGASHFIRRASAGSGFAYSRFNKLRVLQQRGACLTCSAERQAVSYTLRCAPPDFPDLKHYLLDTACRCSYHDWEINELKPIIKTDLIRMDPEQRAIDLVQQACFRGPLSNSVFCEESRVDSMTGEEISCFVRQNYTSDECTIGSVGVPFEETIKLAESVEFVRTKPPPRFLAPSCPRGGVACRDLGPGADTCIAVAVPGSGTCDLSCVVQHAAVAAACGADVSTAGQHATDRTQHAPLGLLAGGDAHTSHRAFHLAYKETGLFGILVNTRACSAREAGLAAAEFLANIGELSFDQLEIGKRRLQLQLARQDDDPVATSEGLALQMATGALLDSARSWMCLLDHTGVDLLKTTALTLATKGAEMSVAIVGDVAAAPTDREMACKACR